MPTVIASGTQTATISTEHTLATDTTNRTYVLKVDVAALALGDTVELRLYSKTLSGGTERLAYYAVYQHAQTAPAVYSVPIPEDISCKATLLQTTGTGRAFPWALLAL
jgi:N-glycosylase/DNA lyase